MKTIKAPALLALAALIAMLSASCAGDGNQRKDGNPAQMQSSDNTLGRDHQ
ncbi:MAG: hypothetical protein V4689_05160 [Verrucomicrobiota bacterium]